MRASAVECELKFIHGRHHTARAQPQCPNGIDRTRVNAEDRCDTVKRPRIEDGARPARRLLGRLADDIDGSRQLRFTLL